MHLINLMHMQLASTLCELRIACYLAVRPVLTLFSDYQQCCYLEASSEASGLTVNRRSDVLAVACIFIP